jgi:hypothetical protein
MRKSEVTATPDPEIASAPSEAYVLRYPVSPELLAEHLDKARLLRARALRRFLVVVFTLGMRRPPI